MTRLAAPAKIVLASAAAAALCAGAPGAARADRADLIFDPLSMDHHTPVSTLNVDFAYVVYDEPTNVDVSVAGLTIAGQYVTPLGIGGYLSIPLSFLDADTPFGNLFPDDSALAVGNLELGGLWAKDLGRDAALVLHGGLALPTAGNDGIAAYQALASSPRYGDFVQRVPDSSWFRIGVSPMGRAGRLFWRVDVGLDLALDEDAFLTYSPIFRVNVGGGIDLGSAHLLAELVTNIANIEPDNGYDETSSTLALGVRFLSGKLRPGLGILLPVDFDGQILDPELAFTASIAARL